MTEEIKVYVINKGRTNLYLSCIDPLIGKQVEPLRAGRPV